MKTPIMIDMQQLNAEPAAVQAVLRIVPHIMLTYIPLATSLSRVDGISGQTRKSGTTIATRQRQVFSM